MREASSCRRRLMRKGSLLSRKDEMLTKFPSRASKVQGGPSSPPHLFSCSRQDEGGKGGGPKMQAIHSWELVPLLHRTTEDERKRKKVPSYSREQR